MTSLKVLANDSMCDIYPLRKLEKLAEYAKSCVKLVKSHHCRVDVNPIYVGDIWFGIRSTLYQNLKKFDPRLRGVLLGFENIRVRTGNGAVTISSTGEVTCTVIADFYIFQPIVGERLKGVVKHKREKHILACTLNYIKVIIRKIGGASENRLFSRLRPGDKFKFVITDYDFTGKTPIIEGRLYG